MWRYTSLKELENIIKASFTSSAMIILSILIINRFKGFARSVFLMDIIFTIFLIGGFRFAIRLYYDYKKRGLFSLKSNNGYKHKKRKKIVIIGAGDAGEMILREINRNADSNYKVVGFLDDNLEKINKYIHGIQILGTIDKIVMLKQKINFDEIIIAIPSASGDKMRRIINLCKKSGLPFKTLPGINELIDGQISIHSIRDVSYSDLIGRSQIELDINKIGAYLKGKRIIVTGAGGSIGSEFCRQIAKFKPEMIIMLDRAESNLYDIEMEIKRCFPEQIIAPVLGSVTCLKMLKRVFSLYKPEVVFHTAAYKHVPMIEIHPWEAIYNNILGTKYTLETAIEYGTERFVLVSTDKAVRPTNIMGASKRVAEIILQLRIQEQIRRIDLKGRPHRTKAMAVRFGNVVGSAGSVIPLFQKQIFHGGPITVTHPNVTRFFMTISEAVQLILQAGAIGEIGNIYILKMGKPIKIIDIAKDLIRLSGLEPDMDIQIKFTGLRPGEKLYEELITEGEGIISTEHENLLVVKNNGNYNNGLNWNILQSKIEELTSLADNHDTDGVKFKLKEIVTDYSPQSDYKSILEVSKNW